MTERLLHTEQTPDFGGDCFPPDFILFKFLANGIAHQIGFGPIEMREQLRNRLALKTLGSDNDRVY